MLTQIYEVRSPEEAFALVKMGVDHIGVLVGDGEFPRELNSKEAGAIFEAVAKANLEVSRTSVVHVTKRVARYEAKKVALFLSCDFEKIARMVKELRPDILHLGALLEALTPADLLELKSKLKTNLPDLKIMRSIPVTGEESIAQAKEYDGGADFLLLDTHKKNDLQIGATGITHDWNISRDIVKSVKIPVILAGGLGPDNVAEAIRFVRPFGVDSKTKTDTADGSRKDLEKTRLFVERAKEAFY
jgi:phosphoribosylanthranilate isomerase